MEDYCCRILVGSPGADGGTIVEGSLPATQDLIDFKIYAGHPGADGGTIVAGPLTATEDLADCIPEGHPGADGGTIVAGSLLATQDLIENCCCRILADYPGADGELLLQDPFRLPRS